MGCYGLKITNLPKVGKYGPLATLKNFRFLFQVKQDCYEPEHDRNGQRYRGNRNVTYSGKTCQHWSSQHPWNHTFQPDSKKYKNTIYQQIIVGILMAPKEVLGA